ncbi:unnamed protein product [Rotaria sp. Silwood1]|nr:unnamed protein product [Rotaria sp. Silwood1]
MIMSLYFDVGGHGSCFDLPEDEANIKLAEAIWNQGKILSAICHGPVALGTNEEEAQVKTTDAIPFLVETRLRELGAKFEKNSKAFGSHVTVDGQLILDANPASVTEFSEKLCVAINKL